MKKNSFYYLFTLTFLMSIALGFAYTETNTLATSKKAETEAALVLETPFDQMMAVLTHQRCVNCHPAGDRPRQSDDRHIHNFGVQRGADNHGLPALRCESCHQA